MSLTACATSGQSAKSVGQTPSNSKHAQPLLAAPDATPFLATANAKADVAEVLRVAQAENKLGLIVMGANWCSDSRALAGHFQTARFQSLLADNYALTYVDMDDKSKNVDIAKSFGIELLEDDTIEGIPTVIVTSSSGQVLNLSDAPTWRNAEKRSSDEIYAYFVEYAGQNSAGKI